MELTTEELEILVERQLQVVRRRHEDAIEELTQQRDAATAERDELQRQLDALQAAYDMSRQLLGEARAERDAAQQKLAECERGLDSGRLSVRNPDEQYIGISDVQRGQTPSEEHPVPPTDGIWLTEGELLNVIVSAHKAYVRDGTLFNASAANAVRQYHERNKVQSWRAQPGQTHTDWEKIALARGREITRLRREIISTYVEDHRQGSTTHDRRRLPRA